MEIGRTQRIYPIEPLVGLRVWRAVDSHSFIHLASMFHGAEWPYSHPLGGRSGGDVLHELSDQGRAA